MGKKVLKKMKSKVNTKKIIIMNRKKLQNIHKTKISDFLIALFMAFLRPLSDISLATWDLGPLPMKIYPHMSDRRENKRNRPKICRNVQLAERMGQL